MTEINHPILGLAFLVGIIVLILLWPSPTGAARYRRGPGWVPAYWVPLFVCGAAMILLGIVFGAGLACRL